MEAKKHSWDLPDHSFLIVREFYVYEGYRDLVSLLTFGYYDGKGKLCYFYHILSGDVFIQVFTDYYRALEYLRKFV